MLLAALVAFVGTLVAFAGVTALLRAWFETRQSFLLAWAITLLCLSVGLGAATIMVALDFRPMLFRAYEVGVALLAMVWLALGTVEMVARAVPAAFVARLFVASISIVAGVILSVDPLRDVASVGGLPSADQLYLQLPLTLLAVAHAGVVLIASASFLVVAMRAWRGEQATGETFLSSLLILVAALCIFVAIRPDLVDLPAVGYMLLLAAASGLIWVAAVRAMHAAGPTQADEWDSADDDGEKSFWSDGPRGSRSGPEAPDDRAESQVAEQPFAPEQRLATGVPSAEHQTDRFAGSGGGAAFAGPASPAPSAPAGVTGHSLANACGFIVIFTLREGAARPFDRLAEMAVEAIHEREPGTLLYACHTVADAPQQRIFYELYRDREAMQEHERQPHVRRFIAEREEYVLATNVVRLKLNHHTGVPEPQLS